MGIKDISNVNIGILMITAGLVLLAFEGFLLILLGINLESLFGKIYEGLDPTGGVVQDPGPMGNVQKQGFSLMQVFHDLYGGVALIATLIPITLILIGTIIFYTASRG